MKKQNLVCSLCKWTNTGLLNLGEPGEPRMVCHGCCKRMYNALEDITFLTVRQRRPGGGSIVINDLGHARKIAENVLYPK